MQQITPPSAEDSMGARIPNALYARFDAAQNNQQNSENWLFTDHMSADAAYSPHVRKTTRERARLEMENNCYARAVVETFVNDVIGRLPLLQLQGGNSTRNQKVEKAWAKWAKATALGKKLRTAYRASVVDGEGLGLIERNPRLPHPVKLDVTTVECDRLTNPLVFDRMLGDRDVMLDGIKTDPYGNVLNYSILDSHPGDYSSSAHNATVYQKHSVIHLFKQERPEQHRGVTRLAPALPLFNNLRRFTQAVLKAAETAANHAGVIQSNQEPGEGDAQPSPMDVLGITQNMLTVLPKGYTMGQLRPEQPTTTYAMFKREIVAEVARCLLMPYSIAAGDSSDSNFASAKMDGGTYREQLQIEQYDLELDLDRLLYQFLQELQTVPGYKDIDIDQDHQWLWHAPELMDTREAGAAETRLRSKQMSYSEFYAKRQKDWEVEFEQIAREQNKLRSLGLTSEDIPIETETTDES